MMTLRHQLADNEPVIGSWINTCSPVVAELMASTGFDFLTVDAEHAAVNVPQAQEIFQAIAAGNPDCSPLVRLPGNDATDVKRFLDAGADGVIAPLVNTPEQAEEVVSAAKYPPDGTRGVGFSRANMYGRRFDETVPDINDETVVCVQIEHIEGVRNIDDILAIEGIDAVFVGPYDLSASMDLTGQFNHPRMTDAVERIREACSEHGVVPGIHIVPPDTDEVKQQLDDGYSMIAYSLDITMLGEICEEGLKTIQKYIDD